MTTQLLTVSKKPLKTVYISIQGALPRTEEASLDDFNEPELGSIFSPGKQNNL